MNTLIKLALIGGLIFVLEDLQARPRRSHHNNPGGGSHHDSSGTGRSQSGGGDGNSEDGPAFRGRMQELAALGQLMGARTPEDDTTGVIGVSFAAARYMEEHGVLPDWAMDSRFIPINRDFMGKELVGGTIYAGIDAVNQNQAHQLLTLLDQPLDADSPAITLANILTASPGPVTEEDIEDARAYFERRGIFPAQLDEALAAVQSHNSNSMGVLLFVSKSALQTLGIDPEVAASEIAPRITVDHLTRIRANGQDEESYFVGGN